MTKWFLILLFSLFWAGPIVESNFALPSNPAVQTNTKVFADKIVVHKKVRRMELLSKGKVFRTYKIALGPHAVGPKEQKGDGKTPEGVYQIAGRNPGSRFHRSLRLSYPNRSDRAQARKKKVSPGGDIFIHGLGRGFSYLGKLHTLHDWTLGCIAVTNGEIDEIWELVKDGTPIDILP